MENKKTLIKNIFWTLLYAVFTLIFVFHHEIWADEAQVWLIAKNLSVFDLSLFKHLVNEGHPSFFYLLIIPFAKLHAPIWTMQAVCWLCSCAAVFLFLNFSPFNNFTKLSVCISAGFLYFFPVIARSYSILPLLVFLTAILYKKQEKHPFLYSLVLFLTANTHVIMEGFVSILFVCFLYDNIKKKRLVQKNVLTACLIILTGLLAASLQLSGSIESNGALGFNMSDFLNNAFGAISAFFLNSTALYTPHVFTNILAVIESLLFATAVFALFLMQKKAGLIFLTAFGFQIFIYTVSYGAIFQARTYTAFVILLFCFWVFYEEKYKYIVSILVSLIFLAALPAGISAGYFDIKFPYSNAKTTAEFIKQNISKDSLIIPTADAYAAGVIAQSPQYRFYSIYTQKDLKYINWHTTGFYKPEDITLSIEDLKEKRNEGKIYLLATRFLDFYRYDLIMPQKYKLIFTSEPSLRQGEAFRIYEYTERK